MREAPFRSEPPGRGPWPNALRVAVSILIAGCMFLADVLTGAKGMAGVLYVPLLVAIASEARRREVTAFGLLGVAFALVAYLIVRERAPQVVSAWPLGVGLASVVVTSVLLRRLVASREALVESNRELAYSEWRYRSIFEQARFPFWERDFSGALAIYERLRAEGVRDLADYNRQNPGFADTLAGAVRTVNVNDAMLKLVGANTRAEFPATLAGMRPDGNRLMLVQQALFDGSTRIDGRTTLTTLDGQVKDVWVTSELSADPARKGIMVGMLVDLTESERAQRTLAAAQAELARASRIATVGALSTSIAHELNQPLAAAVMSAQTSLRYLSRTPPDVASARAAAERAAAEGNRAADIVRRTREAATNRPSPDECVDLGALIREVLGLLEREIEGGAVRVHIETAGEPVHLAADRVALQQVLVNLLLNAIQALQGQAPGDRHVAVDLRRERQDVLVTVRDTGPGIAEEHLGRLFDPFFTTKEDGVGVGLAISRSALEARGGTLRAHNAAGGGAVFECRIPLLRDDA